jgi:hypothetical protein
VIIDIITSPTPDMVRALLRADPIAGAYLVGDLAEDVFGRCRWFLATVRGRPESVVMIFLGLATPAVLSFGAPDGVDAIFVRHQASLPADAWAKIPPEHDAAYRRVYRLVSSEPTWVMGLPVEDFTPASTPSGVRVERLTADLLGPILSVYADYPEHFFEPSAITEHLYYGAFAAGRLAAVAGTHARSAEDGLAVIGNIVTARAAADRGAHRTGFHAARAPRGGTQRAGHRLLPQARLSLEGDDPAVALREARRRCLVTRLRPSGSGVAGSGFAPRLLGGHGGPPLLLSTWPPRGSPSARRRSAAG